MRCKLNMMLLCALRQPMKLHPNSARALLAKSTAAVHLIRDSKRQVTVLLTNGKLCSN